MLVKGRLDLTGRLKGYIRFPMHGHMYIIFANISNFNRCTNHPQRSPILHWQESILLKYFLYCFFAVDIPTVSKLRKQSVLWFQSNTTIYNFICYYFVLVVLWFCTITNKQMHNYFTNYHTATCFDTIVSSSRSS